MRIALLPIVFLASATVTVIACSSDETPADQADAGGNIAGNDGGGSSSGDDDDITKPGEDCNGSSAYDCPKQTAHAKEANCGKFNEKDFKESCEAQNCQNPLTCEKQAKALNDCLLAEPVECKDDGSVSPDTPAGCTQQNKDFLDCLISSGG